MESVAAPAIEKSIAVPPLTVALIGKATASLPFGTLWVPPPGVTFDQFAESPHSLFPAPPVQTKSSASLA